MFSISFRIIPLCFLIIVFSFIKSLNVSALDGECGTAHRAYFYTATNFGSDTFCRVGIPPSPAPTFPTPGSSTTWNCNSPDGGIGVTCTAARQSLPVNGVCGNAHSKKYPSTSTTFGSDSFCANGTVSPVNPPFPQPGMSVTWRCLGLNGGTYASCNASRNPTPVNGVCGTANKTYPQYVNSWGTDTLCVTGTAMPGTVVFPRRNEYANWECLGLNGGEKVSCQAYHSENNVSGSITARDIKPVTNTSSGGVTITCDISAQGASPWRSDLHDPEMNISCPSGIGSKSQSFSKNLNFFSLSSTCDYDIPGTKDAYCNVIKGGIVTSPAPPAYLDSQVIYIIPGVTNGVCGNRSRNYSYLDTSYPLGSSYCSAGYTLQQPDFPGAGSSVSWTCRGENGGSDAPCSASRGRMPVDAVCGSANKTYSGSESDFGSDIFCDAGDPPTNLPVFPGEGSRVSWTCGGLYGGSGTSCNAHRLFAPVNGVCGTAKKDYPAGSTAYGSDTLCSAGISPSPLPSFPTPGNNVTWQCTGEHGGTNVNCTASRADDTRRDAVCGSENGKNYGSTDTDFGSISFCSVGISTPSTPLFPSEGRIVTWTCVGVNGGSDRSCSASRASSPHTPSGICGPREPFRDVSIIERIVSIVTGIWGTGLTSGVFFPDGNAGIIDFNSLPQQAGASGVTFYGNNLLGWFWLQSVGWVNIGDCHPVEMIPPKEGDQNVAYGWTLTGYAWSENAGWINFMTTVPGGQTYYEPKMKTFSGFAWSDTLGWLDFNSGLSTFGTGFIGKVKIIGNISGVNIYETLYSPGESVSSGTTESWINQVHKNVHLLTRSTKEKVNEMGSPYMLTSQGLKLIGNSLILTPSGLNHGVTVATPDRNYFKEIPGLRSIIVMGGDIYIGGDIEKDATIGPRAIIALKNSAGSGGNIYISEKVKYIYASLVAEGSIISGEYQGSAGSPYIYNDTAEKLTSLSQYQLHIQGSLISHNTIGGSIVNPGKKASCPFYIEGCDRIKALPYDLNYFRAYSSGTTLTRAWMDTQYDDYSMIIEYDPRIIQDPPPGLRIES